jgi:leader peptidase (prepilin peptidase)/N-methyltransferase
MTAVWAVGCGFVGLLVGAASERLVATQPTPDEEFAPPVLGDRFVGRRRQITLAVTTALLWAALGAQYSRDAILPAYLALAAGLVPLCVIDLELYLLPNRIVYPLMAVMAGLVSVAAALDSDWSAWKRSAISAGALYAVFFVLWLLAPGGGFGFGDVKLSVALGLALGWLGASEVFTGIFLGFLYGAVVGIGLMVVRGLRARKQPVPFGPFLAAGTLTMLLLASSNVT